MKQQQRVITTPRGNNIGRNIINDLINIGLYKRVDIKTITTERDPINKSNVTTLSYTFIS